MKQEYLMLAQTLKKQHYGGWFASEKLDGCRAFWDGGCSRGMPASSISYANTIKDFRLKMQPVSTGLWSRSGKVINAPDWWLNDLPSCPLDGELYLGPGRFQELRKIIGKHVPGPEWQDVEYRVFDSPPWDVFTKPREVKIRNEYVFFVQTPSFRPKISMDRDWDFDLTQRFLAGLGDQKPVYMVNQEKLPYVEPEEHLHAMMKAVLDVGGEGIMLRDPNSRWLTERSRSLLKVKPCDDAEGVLVGYTAGKGKYLGMIGALIIDFNGKRLELSGMTDVERQFVGNPDCVPGKDMPSDTKSGHFTVGQEITFKYRELSDDGVPKEARYYR